KDLAAMREHVTDLLGDEAKRRAFGVAGRQQVLRRSWKSVCSQLIGHYSRAIENPHPQVLGRGFTVQTGADVEDSSSF
ncbi:MAG: alpha-mannosyltransferase, partial [Brevibacterium sp.]|nr:alpha-mannosyltransferase [Brevibacterium sp.]